MTPRLLFRPVLALLAVAGLSACGADPHRFENLADTVAAIPLDGAPRAAHRPVAAESAPSPLRVEVMDPHSLWDARDASLRGAIEQAAPKLVQAAAPAVAHAMVEQVSERVSKETARLRPLAVAPAAPRRSTTPVAGDRRALVQLGAYSSQASARSAWARLKTGGAAAALRGLQPVYESVQVGDRSLVRLKVPLPAAGAASVCAAAGIDDPWCRRAA